MLAFVHIHKTAGTTLNWILRSSFGLHHFDVEPWSTTSEYFSADDFRRLARWTPSVASLAGHKVRAYGDLHEAAPDVRYYTFLREPVTRMASLYQHGVQKGGLTQSPEEWLEGRRNGQTVRIAGRDDLDEAIRMLEKRFFFVGDVAHFDESLVLLKRRSEDPRFKLSRQVRNVARTDRQKKAIFDDKRLVELIRESTDNDRKLYEYVTQELYPRQRREYGAALESDVEAFRTSPEQNTINARLLANFAMRRVLYRPTLGAVRFLRGDGRRPAA